MHTMSYHPNILGLAPVPDEQAQRADGCVLNLSVKIPVSHPDGTMSSLVQSLD